MKGNHTAAVNDEARAAEAASQTHTAGAAGVHPAFVDRRRVDAPERGAYFASMKRARKGRVRGASAPAPLDDALTQTIRRWAKPTSVDDLSRRGVKTVRSVSMNRVAALLEKAVNRALIARTLESDGGHGSVSEDALSLSSVAREEFMRLSATDLHAPESGDVDAEPLHSRASSTLDRLRRELAERRRTLADHERQLSGDDLDRAADDKLGGKIRELFALHAAPGQDRVLETGVIDLVLGELRVSRRRARRAHLEEHQREVSTLERRIAKLSSLLGETEDALRRMRAGEEIDPGVSSIYDSVQGLSSQDDSYEQKTVLMKSIFEANLALRG